MTDNSDLSRFGEINADQIYSEEEEKQEALKHPVPWDSMSEAYASKKEIALMKEYDRPQVDKLEQFVAHGASYARLFMIFLVRPSNDDAVRYVLTLLDDLLINASTSPNHNTDLHSVLHFFHKLKNGKADPSIPHLPFGAIITVLGRKTEDAYILTLASRILTTFITKIPDVDPETVETTFHWFIELLSKEHAKLHDRKISLGLVGLRPLLQVNEYRMLFISDAIRGLPIIMQLANFEERREGALVPGKPNKKVITKQEKRDDKKGPNFQQIYEAVYLLWALSFNPEVQQRLTEPKLIHNLCHILKRCNKVKVIRISLAVLRNLLGVSKNNELMLSYGIMSSLALLKQKKWGDEELEANIKTIEETLEKNVDDLTSWDKYKNEVFAGQLEWSPPHKSAKFWQENHLKFEEDNYLILQKLREILESNTNNFDLKVLAIACWDIGEFVRVHPHGKLISKTLDLKTPIMKLLKVAENQDDDDAQKLAKEALAALQKLMITNWEYLQQ